MEQKKDSYIVGLDLGANQDHSAAVVLKRASENCYECPLIRRWRLGTSYVEITADIVKMFAGTPISGSPLVIDSTGCGLPVFQMIVKERPEAMPRGALIVGGASESKDERTGLYHVAKTILVSGLKVLFQKQRIKFAERMKEAAIIQRELASYTMKMNLQAHEIYGTRDSVHDDLVMALALASWWANRWRPFTADSIGMDRSGRLCSPERLRAAGIIDQDHDDDPPRRL